MELRTDDLKKVFRTDVVETVALNGVSIDIHDGEFAKINNMCDWIKKIIPEVKSQRLMLDFNFLVDFCSDIPFNDAEKTKIMERLGTIAKSLEEDFSEAEIADLNNNLS